MDRPEVIINIASSFDGIIGSEQGALSLSTEEDWIRVHNLRNSVDAILIGVNTLISDNPLLTVRLTKPKSPHPFRVVLDSKCRIPLESNILKEQDKFPTIVFTSEDSPLAKRKQIQDLNVIVEVILKKTKEDFLDLNTVLQVLNDDYNVGKVLVEGGSTIVTKFLQNNLVDLLYLFYRPVFAGSKGGKSLYNDNTVTDISKALNLKILAIKHSTKGLLITLEPIKNK
ncbi:MAG: RibD family protein [Candidatus Heimdallarchaeota archaeon]|nr:RibD family protein [Candidatus Heimdallarchaeota archaeon]